MTTPTVSRETWDRAYRLARRWGECVCVVDVGYRQIEVLESGLLEGDVVLARTMSPTFMSVETDDE